MKIFWVKFNIDRREKNLLYVGLIGGGFGLDKSTRTTLIHAEVWNAITHGAATILSIIGTFFLMRKGLALEDLPSLVSYIVFGASMVILFLNSTLYHSFKFTHLRDFLQKVDHTSIYLLIAGSYTPIIIRTMNNRIGYTVLTIVWMLAVGGIVYEVLMTNRYPKLSTYLYLGMGWLGIFLIYPLTQAMDWQGIVLLLLGGVTYSVGTLFYRQKHNPWMHVIWHLFVMGGAAFMYFCVYFYT